MGEGALRVTKKNVSILEFHFARTQCTRDSQDLYRGNEFSTKFSTRFSTTLQLSIQLVFNYGLRQVFMQTDTSSYSIVLKARADKNTAPLVHRRKRRDLA